MTTIFWRDSTYGIRRRSAGPLMVAAVCAVALVVLMGPMPTVVRAPGGLAPPSAAAIASSSSAWTAAPWSLPTAPPAPAPDGAAAPGAAPAAPPTTPPAPTTPLAGPSAAVAQLQAVIATLPPIATASGPTVQAGDAPMAPGHWGVYEPETNVVYVGHGAFADAARLRYVAAHELAHAYYFRVATDAQRAAFDAAVAGGPAVRGGAGELYADCVALLWGATTWHYWSCPAPSRDAVAAVLPPA